ncbi:MAG: helix-turn-helix transcriptional regulator [Oscillospiraceae bacterium]|nr:helix-turn-helix transcriptional regulator [Oscillospiraceae bacterium]
MLGQRISEMRALLGWNQVELARKLGVAKQTVSNWENENIQPSIEMLLRLSKIFGVSTDYLLGQDDVPRINMEGLPDVVVAHLTLLIEDYRRR